MSEVDTYLRRYLPLGKQIIPTAEVTASGDTMYVYLGYRSLQLPDPSSGWDVNRLLASLGSYTTEAAANASSFEDGPPGLLLQVPELCAAICQAQDSKVGLGRRWRMATRLSEAAAVGLRPYQADTEVSAAMAEIHRTRFILLSVPFRYPRLGLRDWKIQRNQPAEYADSVFESAGDYLRIYRAARNAWAQILLRSSDYPVLADLDLENEIRNLAWVDPASRQTPLTTANEDKDSPEDRFLPWLSAELATPRFMLRDVWSLAGGRTRCVVLAAALITTAALIIGLLGPQWTEHSYRGVSLVSWVVILAGVFGIGAIAIGTLQRPEFSYPLALRFGGGTVIGAAAIAGLYPEWAITVTNPRGMVELAILGVLLSIASIAYLSIEARVQGVRLARTAIGRASLAYWIGLSYGFFVAALVVHLIAPLFAEDGVALISTLDETAQARAIVMLGVGATTLGVFLQILWEDKPVTYPLISTRRIPPP